MQLFFKQLLNDLGVKEIRPRKSCNLSTFNDWKYIKIISVLVAWIAKSKVTPGMAKKTTSKALIGVWQKIIGNSNNSLLLIQTNKKKQNKIIKNRIRQKHENFILFVTMYVFYSDRGTSYF